MSFVTLNWLNPPYIIQALRYLDFKIQRLQMRVVPDFIDLMHASCFFFFFRSERRNPRENSFYPLEAMSRSTYLNYIV